MLISCGGSTPTYTLEELSNRLDQPAFGIAKEDMDWRAFPPGSLVLAAEGVIDGIPFTSRRVNQEPVYILAADGWLQLQGEATAWVEVDLGVPCGAGMTNVVVWWDFVAVDWPGEPPAIAIDVPSEVSCPDSIPLDHTKSDQEQDIASLRWRVDGVLMEEGTTAVDFTGPHTLTAIVRDERGATRTATKAIACE